jgi:hypothetical protein
VVTDINTAAIREEHSEYRDGILFSYNGPVYALCDEIDRLRNERAMIRAVLEDYTAPRDGTDITSWSSFDAFNHGVDVTKELIERCWHD